MAFLARVVLVAGLHQLCRAERSREGVVQVTLSGKSHLQVQSHHKVRQTSNGDALPQRHPEVNLADARTQTLLGLIFAVVIMLVSALLALMLFRSNLAPASQLWGTMVSTAETTIGISKNLIGAGMLCLPIAASEMSIVGAMVGMSFCCVCSLASFLLIGFACDRLNASSYGELMAAAFGNKYGDKWVGSRMNVILLLHTLSGCIAYMTIIADISTKLAQDSFQIPDIALRGICVTLITLFLLFPLCLHDRLKSLSMTSWLGVTAMMFVAGFCVRDCMADWARARSTEIVASHLISFKKSFFKAVPLINGAYIVHYNAPTFFAETEGRSLFAYGTAAFLAHIAVSILYFMVAFAGFARFGDAVHGNVLTSYETSGHNSVFTCWVCVLLNMVLTVPLLFQRSRQSLMVILAQHFEGNSLYFNSTWILLVFVAICGVFMRHLDTIMMVREATIGVLLMYVLPAVVCIRLLGDKCGETVPNAEDSSSSRAVPEKPSVPIQDRMDKRKMSKSRLSRMRRMHAPDGHRMTHDMIYDANTYRYYLCVSLLLVGVGSSCAALATVIAQTL